METFLHILKFIFVIFEAILIFNLLIVVHELGHFLAARWRGLKVEQFAIWFGKPLWKRTYNGVVYSLGSIPFGGFVKLPQMAPMDAIEGESDTPREALPPVSPLDKIIVAFAGPLFSLGLAFVFAVIVWLVGRPTTEAEANPKGAYIGYVEPDSPASRAPAAAEGVPPGLRPGDKILSVDGHDVKRFGGMNESVVWYVARSEGETIPFVVERDGQTLTFNPRPAGQEKQSGWRRKSLRQVLIEPAYSSIVKSVKKDSPAEQAGLRENDTITEVNGQKLWSTTTFSDYEQSHYGQPLDLAVERDGKTLRLTLPPLPFKIGTVTTRSPAEKEGLKEGDVISTLNGAPIGKFSDLRNAITSLAPNEPLKLTIRSGDKNREVSILPAKPVNDPRRSLSDGDGAKNGQDRPALIGIGPDFGQDGITWVAGGKTTLVKESPQDQIAGSVSSILNTVSAVLAPKSAIGLQHLGGPLFIGRTYYYLLSSDQGWRLALWFSVVLNVNLALLNMLPIPVLDGGHILLALIEAARRKPVNIRLLEIVQTACFIVIASYMLYVTFFDVGDLASSGDKRREVEFASPTPAAGPK